MSIKMRNIAFMKAVEKFGGIGDVPYSQSTMYCQDCGAEILLKDRVIVWKLISPDYAKWEVCQSCGIEKAEELGDCYKLGTPKEHHEYRVNFYKQ